MKGGTGGGIGGGIGGEIGGGGGEIELTLEQEAALRAELTATIGTLQCDALVAFLTQFARIVRELNPRYLAVAFDAGRATARQEVYPAYKANRGPAPALLQPMFPLAVRVLAAVGAKCLVLPGHEADDLMASVGRWARERGLGVVHFSPDKDMLQLIDSGGGVHVMLPSTFEIVGPENVRKKFFIGPEAMTDLQALMGDTSDNVPGVRGVGQALAVALMLHFDGVD
ncbi:PIN domain-like protein, partial [Ochromonadaceae sp. CCMP2298]